MTTERERFLFSVCMALRQIPKGILRDVAKRWLPCDDQCERIAAEAIVRHLELSNWIIRRGPPLAPHSSPPRRAP